MRKTPARIAPACSNCAGEPLGSACRFPARRVAEGWRDRLEGEFFERRSQAALSLFAVFDGVRSRAHKQVSSFCELALALVCSIRHRGVNDIEALTFNTSILARELERVLVLCPDPRRLEPLLSLMAAVRRADLGTGTRSGAHLSVTTDKSTSMDGTSVFSGELVKIFQTLALHPDAERTSRWQQRCARLLGVLPHGKHGAKEVFLSREKVDERALRQLDAAIADQDIADTSRANVVAASAGGAPEILALVLQAYQGRAHTCWLWSRYDCTRAHHAPFPTIFLTAEAREP